jgi:hypothetical protein
LLDRERGARLGPHDVRAAASDAEGGVHGLAGERLHQRPDPPLHSASVERNLVGAGEGLEANEASELAWRQLVQLLALVRNLHRRGHRDAGHLGRTLGVRAG